MPFTENEIREIRRRLNLQSAAQRQASAFAEASHTHAEADVTGLVADLANRAKLDASNVHTGALDTFEQIQVNGPISTDSQVNIGSGTIEAASLTGAHTLSLPDITGTLVTDAPSDGNKYVRKDGGWVLA